MTAAGDLTQIAGSVERFPAAAVQHVLDSLSRSILPELRGDTGGDFRLSGLGTARLRLDTQVIGGLAGGPAIGTLSAGPRKMMGPWRWIDAGTQPRPQGDGRHPGTPGKGTFSDTVDRRLPYLDGQLADLFDRTIR